VETATRRHAVLRAVPRAATPKPFVPRGVTTLPPAMRAVPTVRPTTLPRSGRVPHTSAVVINHRIVWPSPPGRATP
jgi:hypothetical protein